MRRAAKRAVSTSPSRQGRIVAAYGRRVTVEADDGTLYECGTRDRNRDVACGDRVTFNSTSLDQGVIEVVAPRQSLLYRSDMNRLKVIAANVTQVVFVLAAVPTYSEDLLSRCLVAAEGAALKVVVVLNKADLGAPTEQARKELAWVTGLGYGLLALSAKASLAELQPYLHGEISVLVGQSGMGKSTILNKLVPGALARTDEFSEALDSGKHTTTSAKLYHLDEKTDLVDSPGLQEFGLFHLDDHELLQAFPELRAYHGQCRFNNCRHLQEPGCAVSEAAAEGLVSANRLSLYQRLVIMHTDWRQKLKDTGRG